VAQACDNDDRCPDGYAGHLSTASRRRSDKEQADSASLSR
jgi:hypothetical protein